MIRFVIPLLLLLATSAALCEGFAEKSYNEESGGRVALIIGNSSYHEATLANPANDAADLADALKRKGFDVLVREDVGERGLKEAVDLFAKHLKKGGVALFFYAGHGTQLINGENQLIPVDATFQNANDILTKSVSAEHILDLMSSAGSRVNIVILDACRNNPFDSKVSPTNRGLVAMTVRQPGTFISYATAPGSTASDGSGHNGLFTQHLLRSLDEPGSDIEKVFGRVRKGVFEESNKAQLPSTFTSLVENFYLNPEEEKAKMAAQETAPATVAVSESLECPFPSQSFDSAEEQQVWERIKDSQSLKGFTEYLNRFGGSQNSSYACYRWKKLGGTNPKPSSIKIAAPTPVQAPAYTPLPVQASVYTPTPFQPPIQAQASMVNSAATIRDCPYCPELVVVPSGEFMMGRNISDLGSELDQTPQHRVKISQTLAVGRYEVTRGQYTVFVKETGYRTQRTGCNTKLGMGFHNDPMARWISLGFDQTDNDPVVCVSWDDAKAYMDWLLKTTGKRYRFPSEAEWEYMAQSTPIKFLRVEGEAPCKLMNIADASTVSLISTVQHLACNDDYPATAPVGSFAANSLGLFDMLGNAWEWVEDCWNKNYVGAPSDGSSWLHGDCGARVFRGGGWSTPPRILHFAYRDRGDKFDRYDDVGFRVLRAYP